jgi:hypothetical protein
MRIAGDLLLEAKAEFRGETHQARANVGSFPGGVTLDREQGELGADIIALGGTSTVAAAPRSPWRSPRDAAFRPPPHPRSPSLTHLITHAG